MGQLEIHIKRPKSEAFYVHSLKPFQDEKTNISYDINFIVSNLLLKKCKIESAVKNYLDTTLNDPHSYESVSFSNFRMLPYAYEDTIPQGIKLRDSCYALKESGKTYEANKIRHYLDSIDFIYPNAIIRAYRIDHKYRAKNGFGAIISVNKTFVFSPDLKILISLSDAN
jgi:hypothetical protein